MVDLEEDARGRDALERRKKRTMCAGPPRPEIILQEEDVIYTERWDGSMNNFQILRRTDTISPCTVWSFLAFART